MISFEFEDESSLTGAITGATTAIEEEIIGAITLADFELAAYIVAEKLSGQVLNRQTGKLQESILPLSAVRDADGIEGQISQDSAIASYGGIHEFGGAVPERFGNPIMRWIGSEGNPIFRFRAKGFTLPERSFMRSALKDMQGRITDIVNEAVARGLKA